MSVSNGSLSKGPAATSNERPDAGGEPSSYAPKWTSDTYGAAARKVVPLRTPAASQGAPVVAPAPAPASPATRRPAPAPAQPAQRRPTGPELLAEDEVLKRLLQRHAPDPQPLVAKPTRDPLVFALGMVARLMVAGTAAAVAALLLLGVIPLPFRLGSAVTHEVAAPLTAPATMTVAAAPPAAAVSRSVTPVATVAVRAREAPPAASPAPAAAVPVVAPPDGSAPDAGEIEQLIKRGADYLAQGDIAAARLVLGRAAVARDPRAALALGATYDPAMLRQLHVVGVSPDVAQARAWYEKAAAYGSRDARARLAALPSADR